MQAYESQTERVNKVLEVQEAQAKRYDKILDKMEEQMRRQDAILEANERKAGIKSAKPRFQTDALPFLLV